MSEVLAWKMHGRVGDSPIIGAGLFLDNEVGAASWEDANEYCKWASLFIPNTYEFF